MPNSKRILFLTPQLPYPPEQGTAIRNYHLIAQVAQHYTVSLLSFTERNASIPSPLLEICERVEMIPLPTRTLRQRLYTLATSRAPDMAHRLASGAFAQALHQLLRQGAYDILQIEGLEMAPYALIADAWSDIKKPAIILDDHNAEYVLQRRAFMTDLPKPRRWPHAVYSCIQWARLRRFEQQICQRVEGLVVVSERDAEAIRRLGPRSEPIVIPNGVDITHYRTDLLDSLPLQHPNLVFTGKMDFRPNIDAMRWFLRHVWPQILRQEPNIHLYIVGKNPPPEIQRFDRDPQITVTGYVPEIFPYFGGADIYIVPLRVGGGTRLKVLEALACGLPLVSTRLGAEGIDLIDGQHALLADSPTEFAHAVIRLLHDASLRQRLGQQGRRLVETRYDWRQIVPQIYPLYERL